MHSCRYMVGGMGSLCWREELFAQDLGHSLPARRLRAEPMGKRNKLVTWGWVSLVPDLVGGFKENVEDWVDLLEKQTIYLMYLFER